MSDRLPRHIPVAGSRPRYGTWDLAGDREPGTPLNATDQIPDEEWPQATDEQIRVLMQRQRRLSVTAAVVLFGLVFAGVIAGYVAPEYMGRAVWGGFSASFLFAAVLVYPLAWVVAAVYTLISNRMDGLR